MPWGDMQPSQTYFAIGTAAAWLTMVVLAAVFRSPAYAVARGVLVGIVALIAHAVWPHVGLLWPPFLYLHGTVYVQSMMLVRPRMRPLGYRLLVSWPDAFFQAGTLLSLPWAIALGLGYVPPGLSTMYVVAAIGVAQVASRRSLEQIHLVVATQDRVSGPARVKGGDHRVVRPLRIAQITDPHLGAFMSVRRLRAICTRVVESEPDLVMLTGDFLTMESQSDASVLAQALMPLASLRGRVFACLGNHDLEAPDTVRRALSEVGASLLVDRATVVDTPAGRVQILGVDFRWRGRVEHLRQVCDAHPREPHTLRVVLLHDPGAFKALPEGQGDLVLSGHTHGGQLGLVSLGLPYTLMRLFTSTPDHGFWGRGTDRLYVHRGTGHYGFPLRIGVPSEESLLLVHTGASMRG